MIIQIAAILFLSLFIGLYAYVLKFNRPWDLESFFTSVIVTAWIAIAITAVVFLFYTAISAALGSFN